MLVTYPQRQRFGVDETCLNSLPGVYLSRTSGFSLKIAMSCVLRPQALCVSLLGSPLKSLMLAGLYG